MRKSRNKVSVIKKIVIFMLILTAALISGCSLQKDISNLILVRAVAIDKSEKLENGVKLTIESEKTSAASSAQGQQKKEPLIISSDGRTVFDADRDFSNFTEKSQFWGHAEYIFISEAAASEDIRKYLDFFIRNHESRMNALVGVVQSSSASELFKTSGEDVAYKIVADLYENSQATSLSKRLRLLSLLKH